MIARRVAVFTLALLGAMPCAPHQAAAQVLGTACSPNGSNGSYQLTGDTQSFLLCSGGVWTIPATQIGHTSASCNSGEAGVVQWTGSALQYCNGTSWVADGSAAAAGSTGQVQFNGGSGAFGASSNLFWDNTNYRLGIGTASPATALQVNGGEVQVGSSGASCSSANAGAMRYASNTMYYCNGSAWNPFSSSCFGSSTGADTSLASGLVGYWNFNEDNGYIVNDDSGNGNAGEWGSTLGSQWTTGKIGYGGNFNAANWVTIPAPSASNLNINGSYTISAWMKLASSPYSYLIQNTKDYAIFLSSTSITAQFYNSSNTLEPHTYSWTPTTGTWYHLVTVLDATAQKFYIYLNNTQVLNASETNVPAGVVGSTVIGAASNDANPFNGVIRSPADYFGAAILGHQ